jgi:anti-sigma regulatory factor (Ser/Thr protein kinase)
VVERPQPFDEVTPGTARRAVTALLAGVPTSTLDAAGLLTSELVSNAIRHGGGLSAICIRLTDKKVRVDVTDLSSVPPTVLPPNWESPGGRGMLIVNALASWWGVEPIGRGKTVSFELNLGQPEDPI